MSSEFKPRLAVVSSAVRNTLLMILALGCFAAAASAQGTIELGNQTPITNTFPFNFATPRGRFQSAYSASEMAPAAGKYITQIRVFGKFQSGHARDGIPASVTTFSSGPFCVM